MSSKNIIQVFEYQKLRVGEYSFKKKHFEAVSGFNSQINISFLFGCYVFLSSTTLTKISNRPGASLHERFLLFRYLLWQVFYLFTTHPN